MLVGRKRTCVVCGIPAQAVYTCANHAPQPPAETRLHPPAVTCPRCDEPAAILNYGGKTDENVRTVLRGCPNGHRWMAYYTQQYRRLPARDVVWLEDVPPGNPFTTAAP